MTQHAFRAARLAAVVVATSMMLGGASGPGADRRAAPPRYVALGDSYASGFGAGSYTGDCGRSPLGLPGILDAEGQLDLVADATCAGARATSDPGGAADLPEQVDKVIASGGLDTDTRVVSVSVGGNDAGFGEVAVVCASRPAPACSQTIASRSATALPALGAHLDALYGTIRTAAPDAAVVVTGYPHLFSPRFGNDLIPLASQQAFNAGTDSLNALIRSRAEAHGFIFVDVVAPFEDHGLGSPDPWITLRMGASDNLHPTADGYRYGYYPAVRSALDLPQLRR